MTAEDPSSIKSVARQHNCRIVVLSTFPVYPCTHGGQIRAFHLYTAMAPLAEVRIVSLDSQGPLRERTIKNGVTEISIGRSEAHIREESKIQSLLGEIPVTDIVAARLMNFTPLFLRRVRTELSQATIVVLSNPYLVDLLPEDAPYKVLLDEMDIAVDLKTSVLSQAQNSMELLDEVKRIEIKAVDRADKILVCSENDRRRLAELYPATAHKTLVVPNGVDTKEVSFLGIREREALRFQMNIMAPMALFLGSGHPPNIAAVERVLRIAEATPGVHFVVAGSVAQAFLSQPLPPNVSLLGNLDEETKMTVLSIANIAIHPMDMGSGTNLKLLEYMASGLPIISTLHGARGLPGSALANVFLAESDFQFRTQIHHVLNLANRVEYKLAESRVFVENERDWESITSRMRAVCEDI